MKHFIYLLSFVLLIWMSGCGKEDPEDNIPVLSENTTVKIRILNTAENPESGVRVYLFDTPSTQPDGQTPSKALKSETTSEHGLAVFTFNDIQGAKDGDTFYFTVLEEVGSDNYAVLGSVEVSIADGKSLEKNLTVSGRTQYGFFPTTVSHELAMSEYNRWKRTEVVSCNGGLRVIADPSSETKVEAIGFGMLLSAYANDKETFDGLFEFYKGKRTPEANNMMAWDVTCDGISDPGSATDGDIDVAFALIVANKQWGEAYLESAKEILGIISSSLIVECAVNGENIKILAPGYSGGRWGGCNMTDLMYHTSAFFRIFAEVTGNDVWSELADDTYVLLNAGAHPTTGLVPDWQTASGTPGPGGRAGHFGYDACRAPWRITLDYLWNGNTSAKEWASKISGWAEGVGPANLVDGYELDGTPIGQYGLNSSFLGGFTVAAMSHSQARVNNFGSELSKLNDSYWFNLNTRCLYLFTLTGNFWNPMEE